MKFSRNDIERFEAKYIPEPNSGCWLWMAGINKYGYGHFMMRNPKRMERAHRISYQMAGKKIPRGKMILHICDVRCCVNPEHLVSGTQSENMQQCLRRNRYSKHKAILTEKQVLEIRANTGELNRTLAGKYGVHEATISDIKLRKYWKHI